MARSRLKQFFNDTVSLLKQDGTQFDNIQASVQPEKIYIEDETLPIEEGDVILRTLKNGLTDRYIVIESTFRQNISPRLPSHYEIRYRKATALESAPRKSLATSDIDYVDKARIAELSAIQSARFDLSKLIKMCEELNICYSNECYFAVAMLVRAIIDHVPPIFGCDTFASVVNNAQISRSAKDVIRNLQEGSRKIGDMYLHSHIQAKEPLPNGTTVNFKNYLDVLLAEIVRKVSV